MGANSLLWAMFALLVPAQNTGLPVSGPLSPGPGRTPEEWRVSEAAGRQPNATNSVTFMRTYNNTPETWTWRINVTDMAIPNQISDLGSPSANFSQGLHVANTQWQLQWPGNSDSFQSFLRERNVSVSFTALMTNKPSNITDRYNDADNGNCTNMLGDKCTQSLIQTAARGSPIGFATLEGCENTLAVSGGNQGGGTSFDIDPNFNYTDAAILRSNGTLIYRTSDTYSSGNLTPFNQSTSALQVLLMNFKYPPGVSRGDTSGPTVLCRIVNKAATPQVGSAVGWRQSAVALWGMAILSTLLIML